MAINVLNQNEVLGGLYNQIINIQTFANPIKGTFSKLVDMARTQGSKYGDKMQFISTDALASRDWLNDQEAANLLNIKRPSAPKIQELVIDRFRIVEVTIDNYMSKRAFSTEFAFSQFNSVILGWIRDTKRIYDATLVNTYMGTTVSAIGSQYQQITLPTATDKESENRLQAQTIAEKIANIAIEVTDVSRDYNDNAFMRSYELGDLVLVINSEVNNKINKLDLPSLYHDDIFKEFDKVVLPARYFGTVNTSGGTVGSTNITIRSLVEKDYTVSGNTTHCYMGDLLPAGATYLANETYTVDSKVLFKIMHKDSLKLMSGFESETTFFNPKSLTENHYLIWSHNDLDFLKEYPFITVIGNVASEDKN